MHNQGRVVFDAILPMDMLGKLRKHSHTRLTTCLLGHLVEVLTIDGPKTAQRFLDLEARVPDMQLAHLCKSPHVLAIRLDAPQDGLSITVCREAVAPAGDDNAGGQALHIPLPRPRQGLIEIIHIEDLSAFRRRIDAEVTEMCIATHLCRNPCD